MLCFRDMSFCSSDCTNDKCFRHFGDDDAEAAKKWWGDNCLKGDPPISFMDFSGDCPDYKKP